MPRFVESVVGSIVLTSGLEFIRRVMRNTAVLFATLVLAACSKAPVTRTDSQPASPAVVQFLLTSAASDFHIHRPPGSVRFRDVRVGHVKTPSREDQYMLCGRFLPGQESGGNEGTPFVTIKTSGYEQYIGAQAEASYCQRPSVIWNEEGDLSASLQSRFDSLDSAGS
jgi:hypothetical protein